MFSLEMLEKDYDMNSPEGKTDFFMKEVREGFEFDEEIERNNYIEAVAKDLSCRREELRKLVGKMAVQTGTCKAGAERPRDIQISQEEGKGRRKVSQKILLTWMIDDEEFFTD